MKQRGAKSLKPAKSVGTELVNQTPADVARDQAQSIALDNALLASSEALIRAGRMQVHNFYQNLGRVGAVREFDRVRESKEYKNLPYRDHDGNLRHVGDLQEYCEAFLGKSYSAVAEDSQNLATLGDALYENALRLGLTTRDFRDLRALPQDDQELVKEAISTKKVEAVIEILETAITKHQKEKRSLEKRNKDLEADLEAQRRVTQKKNEKLDALEAQVHRRMNSLPEQMHALQVAGADAVSQGVDAIQKLTQVRIAATEMLNGNERDANDDNVRGTVGHSQLTFLWQLQAWLSQEIELAEMVFGGTKTELNATSKRGPELAASEITRLQDAGADEVARVVVVPATESN